MRNVSTRQELWRLRRDTDSAHEADATVYLSSPEGEGRGGKVFQAEELFRSLAEQENGSNPPIY